MLFHPKATIARFLNKNLKIKVVDILVLAGGLAICAAAAKWFLETSNITITISSRKIHGF